jgi:hypothetical protein
VATYLALVVCLKRLSTPIPKVSRSGWQLSRSKRRMANLSPRGIC